MSDPAIIGFMCAMSFFAGIIFGVYFQQREIEEDEHDDTPVG